MGELSLRQKIELMKVFKFVAIEYNTSRGFAGFEDWYENHREGTNSYMSVLYEYIAEKNRKPQTRIYRLSVSHLEEVFREINSGRLTLN